MLVFIIKSSETVPPTVFQQLKNMLYKWRTTNTYTFYELNLEVFRYKFHTVFFISIYCFLNNKCLENRVNLTHSSCKRASVYLNFNSCKYYTYLKPAQSHCVWFLYKHLKIIKYGMYKKKFHLIF